jgi:predicted aminopeptidase
LYSELHKNAAAMRKDKARAINDLRADLEILQNDPGFSGLQGWLRKPMNNATLGSVAVYHKHVPAFLKLFENCNQKFPDYFKAVEQLGKLPLSERQRALEALCLSAP